VTTSDGTRFRIAQYSVTPFIRVLPFLLRNRRRLDRVFKEATASQGETPKTNDGGETPTVHWIRPSVGFLVATGLLGLAVELVALFVK